MKEKNTEMRRTVVRKRRKVSCMVGLESVFNDKKPSVLTPFLSLSPHATRCSLKHVQRSSANERGLRCFWKFDPARETEGHSVNNSCVSLPKSHSPEERSDHSEPPGLGSRAQMQLDRLYCSRAHSKSHVRDLVASSGEIGDYNIWKSVPNRLVSLEDYLRRI